MIPYGNVDTEQGGIGQPYSVSQEDVAPTIETPPVYAEQYAPASAPRATNNIDHYASIGNAIMQLMQAQQQLQQQQRPAQSMFQPRQQEQQQGASTENLDLGANALTTGFNMNWLSERLAAGSANGAKIGGTSMNTKGGDKKKKDDTSDNFSDYGGGAEAGWAGPGTGTGN